MPASRRGSGEGSLAKDEVTGLWVARVELPPHPITGVRRRRVQRRKNKGEAATLLQTMLAELREQGDLPTSTPTVAGWLDHWYRDIDKSKPSTRRVCRTHISQYLVPALGKVKIDHISDADLKRMADLIVVHKGLTSTTARSAWGTLERALDAAVRGRIIARNPTRISNYRPKRSKPKVGVLTAEEAIRVIRGTKDERLGSRWALALLTAARQGEALGIELDRVDLKDSRIDLSWQLQTITYSHGCKRLKEGAWECGWTRGHKCPQRFVDASPDYELRHLVGVQYLVRPKTERSRRSLPLVGALRDLVERRIADAALEPNPYGLLWTADPKRRWYAGTHKVEVLPLDGLPIDSSTDSKRWDLMLKEQGVSDVRLHDARRTTISLLYTLGVPESVIQDVAGHVDPETSRLYRDVDLGPASKALAQLNDLLS